VNVVSDKFKYRSTSVFFWVFVLTQASSESSRSPIWTGKPWILPSAIVRAILLFVLTVVLVWLEFVLNAANQFFFGLNLATWTILAFLIIFGASIIDLLLLRASNTYTLRDDSLEVKKGIITTTSFVVAPAGFGNMELVRSLSGRILNMGDIIIHTQNPDDSGTKLVMIRDPEKPATQIREVMSKPIVRIEK
jgi:uncharacterized membrane protein YdbT with pleckstrin-like domain